ncbi:hypothetical protein J3B02_004425, partial [Coemansia erecta]
MVYEGDQCVAGQCRVWYLNVQVVYYDPFEVDFQCMDWADCCVLVSCNVDWALNGVACPSLLGTYDWDKDTVLFKTDLISCNALNVSWVHKAQGAKEPANLTCKEH